MWSKIYVLITESYENTKYKNSKILRKLQSYQFK